MPPWIAQYDPDDNNLRLECDKEFKIIKAAHQKAQDWYDGVIPDVLKVTKRGGIEIDNNVKLNMFAKRMDRRRDFLFKTFPDLDIDSGNKQNAEGALNDDAASPDDSTAEDWLEDAWDWNRADTLWGLALLNGGFTGQVYAECRSPRPGRDKFPRCILLSNMITVWQADDVDTHLWYEKHYSVGEIDYRQDIVDNYAVSDGAKKNWTIYEYKKSRSATKWELVTTIEWPHELGPIVTWQHWPRAQRCYGAGEFGDIAINTAVNRIMSLGLAVIRNHAFPKTIGTGFSAKKLEETSVDGFWSIDDKDAKVYNLEMQSDLSTILNYTERLSNDYNSQGRTTDIAGGPADFTNITNLAIKVSFMPQDDANEILKRQYGYGIVETSKRLQMLAGQDYSSDPIVVWKPSLPESKLEIAQVAQIEDTLNLASKETQATQMGLDWIQEQERMQIEQTVSKVRRFSKPEIAAAGAAFEGAPDLATLKAKKAAGSNGIAPVAVGPPVKGGMMGGGGG